MASSPLFDNATISEIAQKIADARKLYGADSTYVIGLFAGLDLVLESSDSDKLKRVLRERVIDIESGKSPSPKPSPEETDTETETTESGLSENKWTKGSVKWFNNDKGYGFISTESATDVFVHWRDISSWDRSLGQGDEVEFMVTKTAKGFQAINVMKADKDTSPKQEGEDSPSEASAVTDDGKGEPAAPAAEAASADQSAESEGAASAPADASASEEDGDAAQVETAEAGQGSSVGQPLSEPEASDPTPGESVESTSGVAADRDSGEASSEAAAQGE